MSDLSAISGLSSLYGLSERDAYYQYLINNNSTSTMLNALSGDSDDSTDSGLSGISNLLSQASSLSGTTSSSLSGLSSLIGSSSSDSDGSSLSVLTSFSQILKTYLSSEQAEAANMADAMSEALKEADAASEDAGSVTYKTVQELYEYFSEKAKAEGKTDISSASESASSSVSSGNSTSSLTEAADISGQMGTVAEFDFDGFESDVESSIEAAMVSAGINM